MQTTVGINRSCRATPPRALPPIRPTLLLELMTAEGPETIPWVLVLCVLCGIKWKFNWFALALHLAWASHNCEIWALRRGGKWDGRAWSFIIMDGWIWPGRDMCGFKGNRTHSWQKITWARNHFANITELHKRHLFGTFPKFLPVSACQNANVHRLTGFVPSLCPIKCKIYSIKASVKVCNWCLLMKSNLTGLSSDTSHPGLLLLLHRSPPHVSLFNLGQKSVDYRRSPEWAH